MLNRRAPPPPAPRFLPLRRSSHPRFAEDRDDFVTHTQLQITDMPPTADTQSSTTWMSFALLTVLCWGTYGIFLATGAEGMHDHANGRIKAFLFVGLAYFLVAVLAPLLILVLSGANWNYPVS